MPNGQANTLIVSGHDIGSSDLSCYSQSLMGDHTPNAYRVADGGALLTDDYGEQSCGSVLNGIVSYIDSFTTVAAAAGIADVAERLRSGATLDRRVYGVHVDGQHMLPYRIGQLDESLHEFPHPRQPASHTMDNVLAKIEAGTGSS